MVNIRFNPDISAIRAACESQVNARLTYLLNKADKTFSLIIGPNTYKLRYEVLNMPHIQLYVQTPLGNFSDISSPKLQLNIGSFLLPDALDLGISAKGYNPETQNSCTRDILDSGLSETEIQAIHTKIAEIGLLQLIC